MHEFNMAFHALHAFVIFEYLLIATQFFTAFSTIPKAKRTARSRAQAYLVVIFVLCSILGYVSQIIHFWQPLHYALLIVHIVVTGVFVLKNHARTLLDGVADD